MIKDIISGRYAEALFRMAREHNIAPLIDREIGSLAEMAFSAEKYRSFWANPVVSQEAKMKLLESILGIFQVSKPSEGFLRLLIRKSRFRLLPTILAGFRKRVAEAEGVADVTVVSAVPLESAALEGVRTVLQNKLAQRVRIDAKIDESLLGGVVVKIGNKIIDGSVKNRLRTMHDWIQKGSLL